ncbi:sciellin isoform X2 [Girardinichthys multiradiatus]|uniref:sciellin isoform X2 n=1 Tax=Girardinichthys multiradiatus TaxID=208333 RepID=UPI001FAD57BC|nr:sciellin isoform X2 [Girardinichthys multiradiatus]
MSSYPSSKTQAIEDSKKKTSRLKDNSWIRKTNDEDEPVDQDPNFGKTVLGKVKTSETAVSSSEPLPEKVAQPRGSSVQALTQRFSGSREDLKTMTPSYYSKRNSSGKTETSSTTKTTTVTHGGTTEMTTTTTTQSVKSPVTKSATKTDTFMDRVKSSSQGPQYVNYSPTKTTKPTITSTKDVDNKLNNSPTPSSVKDDSSTTNSKTTVTTTETVTVKDSSDAKSKDKLYDLLLPDAITSPVSSSTTVKETIKVSSRKEEESPPTPSTTRSLSYSSYPDDTSYTHSSSYSSEYKTYSYSKPDSSYEYSSLKSPSLYTSTSYKSSSLSDDILSDPIYSKSSTKSVYKSPDRPVLEKDLCTSCRKPFTGDAKMVLDDIKIRCHATCFKCDVCNGSLSNLKAGDSMWIYKRMVHCENCFEITRDKWRR